MEIVDESLEVREGGSVEVAIFEGKTLLAVRFDLVEEYGWGLLVLPPVRTDGGQ